MSREILRRLPERDGGYQVAFTWNAVALNKVLGILWAQYPSGYRSLLDAIDQKPRIEEPRGLGAVVVDVEGIRWTRVESGEAQTRNPWYPADADDFQPDEWGNLCAVEVLSEGVTP